MATFRIRKTNSGQRRYQARVQGVGSKTFTTMQDAKHWAAEVERQKRLGELYEAPPESFGALLDAFIVRKKHGWRPSTLQTKMETKEYLKALRPVPIGRVTYALLADEISGVAVRAPNRAGKALALAKSVLRDAEQRGHRVDRKALAVEKPRYEERERRFLTYEQLQELASFAPDLSNIIMVAGLSGLRQGELFDLLASDLDLVANVLHVHRGKTKASRRTVALTDAVVAILRAQLLSRPPGTERVFPDAQGGRQDRNKGFGKKFRAACEAAGLQGVCFHDLRRTYVSLNIRAGVDLRTIAQQVGHSDGGALLLKRYGFLYESAGQEAADKLSLLLRAEAR